MDLLNEKNVNQFYIMPETELINNIREKKKQGLLDYKWEIRSYLLNNQQPLTGSSRLFKLCVSPFIYLNKYRISIQFEI